MDWEKFLRVVRMHRIQGLAYDAFSRTRVEVPAEVRSHLRTTAARIMRKNLFLAAEAVRLRDDFDDAGVEVLFIKGTTLAKLAYGSLAIKSAGDIDLLVAREDLETAMSLLARSGYRRVTPDPALGGANFEHYQRRRKETGWLNADKRVAVDLHHALSGSAHILPTLSVQSPRQEVVIDGEEALQTLADAELYSYLCYHGATHAWSRLKWLADLAALLSARTAADVRSLHASAEALGAGRSSALALLLCKRLFELSIAADLLEDLRADPVLARLEKLSLGAIASDWSGGEPHEASVVKMGSLLSEFLLLPGWRHRADVARNWWYHAGDRVSLPLPEALAFLYPILRVPMALIRVAGRR